METFTKVCAKSQGYEDFELYIIAIARVGNIGVIDWFMNIKDKVCVKAGDEVVLGAPYIDKHNKYKYIIRCG